MPTEQIEGLAEVVERVLAADDVVTGTIDDPVQNRGRVRGFNLAIGPAGGAAQVEMWPDEGMAKLIRTFRVSRAVAEQVTESDIEAAMEHADSREDAHETVVRRDLRNIVEDEADAFSDAFRDAHRSGIQISPLYYPATDGEMIDGAQFEARLGVLEQYTTGEYIRDRDALIQAYDDFYHSLSGRLPIDELDQDDGMIEAGDQEEAVDAGNRNHDRMFR